MVTSTINCDRFIFKILWLELLISNIKHQKHTFILIFKKKKIFLIIKLNDKLFSHPMYQL